MTERCGFDYPLDVAQHYDTWFGHFVDTDTIVEALAKVAGTGPALELGIGTGRVALPLARRGIDVHGIEASEAMAQQLATKPGGADIPVTIGDFSSTRVGASFSLVYVVAGTFCELQSQEGQIRCFVNAARHLAPRGMFVLDAHLPEALHRSQRSGMEVVSTDDRTLILRFRQVNLSTQHYESHYVIIEDGRVRYLRVPFRYVSPGELDVMARLAGLRLADRWGSWAGQPFTRDSSYQVSFYELVDKSEP
jgi:SAM-dependent methyltransferase